MSPPQTSHAMLADSRHSQLLIIDIQERLASAMPTEVLAQVVHNTGILLQAAASLQLPVLRTEQYPKGLGTTLTSVADRLPAQCERIEKTSFSCCGALGFNQQLAKSGRSQVIIAGMETHVCVLQTALELQNSGQQVFVAADAVCSRRQFHHQNALARLQQAGVIVSNTESILFEWLRDAAHTQFKALSKLIR